MCFLNTPTHLSALPPINPPHTPHTHNTHTNKQKSPPTLQSGILDKYGVELIGAKLPSIDRAEDRELFKQAMARIGLKVRVCFECCGRLCVCVGPPRRQGSSHWAPNTPPPPPNPPPPPLSRCR